MAESGVKLKLLAPPMVICE